MRVLVTGASGGIGKAVCRLFLEQGHQVIGLDLLLSDLFSESYEHVIHDICDTDWPDLGVIEVLVNCAGVQTQTAEDIVINLSATIELTEHYAVQENIHSVVNVSSASALTGSEFPHYAASKGGLTAYTKNLALRLARYGATVNAVCPGGVITDLNRHILEDDELYAAVLDESLLHRWSSPEEIAEWVVFLACVNRSMTGENLLIDNGEALKSIFIW